LYTGPSPSTGRIITDAQYDSRGPVVEPVDEDTGEERDQQPGCSGGGQATAPPPKLMVAIGSAT
jgi:hypothetical protein